MAGYGRLSVISSAHWSLYRNCLPNFCQTAAYSSKLQKCLKAIGLPEKPKRPAPPFASFAKRIRTQLVAENPNTSALGIMKIASTKWAALDPNEKQEYKNDYDKNIEEYKLKAKKYEEALTTEQKEKIQKCYEMNNKNIQKAETKKKLTSLGMPKRPKNPFFQFMTELRTKGVDYSRTDYSKMWKALSEEDRQVYVARSIADSKEFSEKVQEWKKKMIEMGHEEFVETPKKSKRKGALETESNLGQGTKKTDYGIIRQKDQLSSQVIENECSTHDEANTSENRRPSNTTISEHQEKNTTQQNLRTFNNTEIAEFSTGERVTGKTKSTIFKRFAINQTSVMSTNSKYIMPGMCTFILFSIFMWRFYV